MIQSIIRRLRSMSAVLSPQEWRRIAGVFVVFAMLIGLFVALASEIREQEQLPFDQPILEWVHGAATPALDTVVAATTDFGYVWWVGGIAALVLGWLLFRRRFLASAFVAISLGGSTLINLALKALFQRDRPMLWERLVTENTASFPSGHAMASCALALVLVVLCWPTRWRWWMVSAAVCYVGYVGWTRLYLGVHYPSDIIAGWAVSSVWAGIVGVGIYGKKMWRRTAQ